MTQESQAVLDDEDQMSAALAEIRSERADEPAAVVEAAPVAQEPSAEEPAAADPQPATEAAAPAQPDPVEQLKAVQAELHKARSEIGRVDALNRKYMEAAREAAALREQLAKAQRPAPAESPVNTEALAKLAAVQEQVKDFPELAGIVAAVSDALKLADKKTEEVARRVAAQVVEPLEPLRREQVSRVESEQKAAFDAALETFNNTYPTAGDVVKSAEFNDWLRKQPGPVQYAFDKGQTPQEAIAVMDAYDMHLRRAGLQPIARIPSSQPEPQAQKSGPDTSRLQRAAGLPSRSTGSAGSAPPADDFDASLAYFRQKRLQAARASA